MRKLIVVSFMSTDGFYEGKGKRVQALPMDDAFFRYNLERMKAADTVLLGAKSYRQFATFWPPLEHDKSERPFNREFARLYNHAVTKVVVSDHAKLPPADHPWADSTEIIKRRETKRAINQLKRSKGREIVMWGSRTLWMELIALGLVDEFHLIVGAEIIGEGTAIFKGLVAEIELLEHRAFRDSSSVLLRYQVGKARRRSKRQ